MEDHPYQQVVETLNAWLLSESQDIQLRPASDASIQWLRAMRVPESVVTFFAVAEPSRWIDIEGVEIGPIAGLKDANTQAVPGIATSQHGYVVIAKCISGDVYCLESNQEAQIEQIPIYIVNHEKIGETASKEEVEAAVRLVVTGFHEFLSKFIARDLPYDFSHAI